MKLLIYPFFTFLILTSLASLAQKTATSTKKTVKSTTSKSGSPAEKLLRPFYINTVISTADSVTENRVIKILGDDLAPDGFLFEVRNRWGDPIYSSESLLDMTTSGWDGKKEEALISPGVYSFTVRYQTTNGERFQKVGFITAQ
ncbi:MAG: hypothetical protein DI538_26750 [Azospira oryzae]|nr:hypothetical protein [Cytophaga sp.]PZR26139.1 MAG: hypothetical protein DI538_26750 [Azospira oryzae]